MLERFGISFQHCLFSGLSFHFDDLEPPDRQSSISWESSSNFSPENSCQNCSFNFWSQKFKQQETVIGQKSKTFQKLVQKVIFKVCNTS